MMDWSSSAGRFKRSSAVPYSSKNFGTCQSAFVNIPINPSRLLRILILCLIYGSSLRTSHFGLAKQVLLLDTRLVTGELRWKTHSNTGSPEEGWMEETFPSVEDGTNFRAYVVCEVHRENVDNWVRSPYIPRGTANRITVEVTFTMRDCKEFPGQTKTCGETFTLLYHEADADYDADPFARHPKWKETVKAADGFKQIDRITGDSRRYSEKDEAAHNVETRSIPVSGNGVYIAFRDEGACTYIQAVKVYYEVCEDEIVQLAYFAETPGGSKSTDLVETAGVCVRNAKSATLNRSPKYLCKSDGTWARLSGECVCNPGYVSNDQRKACEACAIGEYSVGDGSVCKPCPAKSVSRSRGSSECRCLPGYYRDRKSDTVDMACTQPPSQPLDVRIVSKTETAAVIQWIEPASKGGREELWYRIECQNCPGSIEFSPRGPRIRQTNLTVSGLRPSSSVSLFIYAENNVSDQVLSQRAKYSVIEVTTTPSMSSGPVGSDGSGADGLSNVRVVARSGKSLRLKWDPPTSVRTRTTEVPSSGAYVMNDDFVDMNEGGITIGNIDVGDGGNEMVQYEIEWFGMVPDDSAPRDGKGRFSPGNELGGSHVTRLPMIDINNLVPDTQYRIRVRPLVVGQDAGEWSPYVYGTTGDSQMTQITPVIWAHRESGKTRNVGETDNQTPSSASTIALIAIGCVAVFGIFLLLVCCCVANVSRRRRKRKNKNKSSSSAASSPSSIDHLDFKNGRRYGDGPIIMNNSPDLLVVDSPRHQQHLHHEHYNAYHGSHCRPQQHTLTRKVTAPLMCGGSSDFSSYNDDVCNRLHCTESNYEDPRPLLLQDYADEIDQKYIFIEEVILGGGEFGNVYQAQLKIPGRLAQTVAIKCLKKGSSPKIRRDFLQEALIMGQFDHENVIKLVGVKTKVEPVMIITEYMKNKSLDKYLRDHANSIPLTRQLNMLHDVCAGMKYLSDKDFVHRDLAARNVLVDDRLVCKIGDFGLSRLVDSYDQTYETQGGKVPVRWTAPEAITHKTYSHSSDVWSYGILSWEVSSGGRRPYGSWTNHQVQDQVVNGYRLPCPPNCPPQLYYLMLKCWEKDQLKRPTFGDILSVLELFINNPNSIMDTADQVLLFMNHDNHHSSLLSSSPTNVNNAYNTLLPPPSSHYHHQQQQQQHSSLASRGAVPPPSDATTSTPLDGSSGASSSLDESGGEGHHCDQEQQQQSSIITVPQFLTDINLDHCYDLLWTGNVRSVPYLSRLSLVDLMRHGVCQSDAQQILDAIQRYSPTSVSHQQQTQLTSTLSRCSQRQQQQQHYGGHNHALSLHQSPATTRRSPYNHSIPVSPMATAAPTPAPPQGPPPSCPPSSLTLQPTSGCTNNSPFSSNLNAAAPTAPPSVHNISSKPSSTLLTSMTTTTVVGTSPITSRSGANGGGVVQQGKGIFI